MEAKYPGYCPYCDHEIAVGEVIGRKGSSRWGHYTCLFGSAEETPQQQQQQQKEEKKPCLIMQNSFSVSFKYDAATVAAVKALPLSARRWDANKRVWWVDCRLIHVLAAGLASTNPDLSRALSTGTEYAPARTEYDRIQTEIEMSRAATCDISIPVPEGLTYLPYQKAGIKYALKRTYTLIADEMGLGKTVQAIGVINADSSIKKILVLCPASLKINWQRELEKWLVVDELTVGVVNGQWQETDVVICNYDVAKKFAKQLHSTEWDLVICDESHKLKNPKAQRTVAVLGSERPARPALKAKKWLCLTGTPIPNRPVELWPILKVLDPDGLGSKFFGFVRAYCGACETRYGWDFSGATNLADLQERLRTRIMIRRTKDQVLAELPAKTRQLVVLPANGLSNLIKREEVFVKNSEDHIHKLAAKVELAKTKSVNAYEKTVAELTAAKQAIFTEMSKLRHEIALAKAPIVAEMVTEMLEDDNEKKIVIFAHHKDVVAQLCEYLEKFGVVSLTGETPMVNRQKAVDDFQTDPTVRIFIGNIQAAGVGITLTASSHVIFAELDWVPANITQAEDRCHRIGQRDHVLIQHVVVDGSLDVRLAETLIEKQRIMDAALDTQHADRSAEMAATIATAAADVPTSPTPSTSPTTTPAQSWGDIAIERRSAGSKLLGSRKQLEKIAESLTASQIDAILTGIKILTGMCDGAVMRDGVGFSKRDVFIGKTLARKRSLKPLEAALAQQLLRIYQGQLDTACLVDAGINPKEEK